MMQTPLMLSPPLEGGQMEYLNSWDPHPTPETTTHHAAELRYSCLTPTSDESTSSVITSDLNSPVSVEPPSSSTQRGAGVAVPKKKRSGKRSSGSYKHVPHREKPPHLVARRNARERRRVQAVNGAFARLRRCVPVENRSKRLSKVKTLQRAIEYINALQHLLDSSEDQQQEVTSSTSTMLPEQSGEIAPIYTPPEKSDFSQISTSHHLNKENAGWQEDQYANSQNLILSGSVYNSYFPPSYTTSTASPTLCPGQVCDSYVTSYGFLPPSRLLHT